MNQCMDNKRKMWAIERERTEKEFKPNKRIQPIQKNVVEYKRVKATTRISPPKIPILLPTQEKK